MQIAAASPGHQALLVVVEDTFFMLFATFFLMTGERFGNQRHPQAVSYPGEQALLLHCGFALHPSRVHNFAWPDLHLLTCQC